MRLVWVLLSTLLCAASAWLGALWFSVFPTREDGNGAAQLARLALASDARTVRRVLALSCERDAQIERLLLELNAGAADTGALRLRDGLGRVLGGQVGLFVEHAGKLESLVPEAHAELPLLRRAARVRVAAEASVETALFDACARRQAARTLWILRSTSLANVLRAAQLLPSRYRVEAANAALPTEAGASLETSDGSTLRVVPLPKDQSSEAQLTPLLTISAIAGLLGALLGLFLTRRRVAVDESVLATLEQAAARVAQGDLSSQIGVRFGGRADQTLNSFDRMTAELRDMREKLADAERAAAWQDMAQRIAHEIKNPLSPIRTALETLRKAHDKRLPAFDEIFDESTHAMLEEVQRMERIVREFSEFARLPKARPGAMSLSALVSETARLYTPDDVELTLALPADEAPIHADREQLTQVLVNLVTNAVHAARERNAPQVRVSVEQSEHETLLHVEDSGPGVPAADRSRIFQPYVTGKEHGTGLGLAIVRRIVSDHGGTIGVSDSELGGACFTLRLPS